MILRDKDRKALLAIAQKFLSSDITILAYGSRVNGTAHETSDLDLVLKSNDEKPVALGVFSNFIEAVEESNIPILVQISDWYRIPESFKKNILEKHEILR